MADAGKTLTEYIHVTLPPDLKGAADSFKGSLGLIDEIYGKQLSKELTLSLEKSLWHEITENLKKCAASLSGDARRNYESGVNALERGIFDLFPLDARSGNGNEGIELIIGKVFSPEGDGESYYSGAAGAENRGYDPLLREYDDNMGLFTDALMLSRGYKGKVFQGDLPQIKCLDVFSLAGGLNARHKPICVFFSGGTKENVSSLSRMTVFINLYAARFKALTEPIALRYLAGAEALAELSLEETARLLLIWLRGHDAGHFIGADRLGRVMSEFDSNYMVLHELKSDMIALSNMKHLSGSLLGGGLLHKAYLLAVAEMLRYMRREGFVKHPDTGSAYLAYRHLSDMGAIRHDPWGGKFIVDIERFERVVDEFAWDLVRLFADGNETRARGFVNSWGWLGVEDTDGLPRGCPEALKRMIADTDIPHVIDYNFVTRFG
ncbi:MAG: hypothetical protein AB1598_05115 [Thermodesulfobacteriota bacterium]